MLIWFISGAIIGSFLLVVIKRFALDQPKSVINGRSICDSCGKRLTWKDLFPILSYLILRGQCRYCGKKIPPVHLYFELLIGLLFMTIGLTGNLNALLVINLVVISLLIIIAGIDFITMEIVEVLVLIAGIAGGLSFMLSGGSWLELALGAIIGGGIFLGLALPKGGKWMGMGDVELGAALGLWLGYPNILVALMISFIGGSLISLILIATGKLTMKSRVPFGPFLVMGGIGAFFLGEKVLNWYLGG